MPKRTTVVLLREQERAVKRIMAEEECNQTEAINILLTRGVEAEGWRKMVEGVSLKTFFYLRQIARERGDDFVQNIEQNFNEVKERMLEGAREGFAGVDK